MFLGIFTKEHIVPWYIYQGTCLRMFGVFTNVQCISLYIYQHSIYFNVISMQFLVFLSGLQHFCCTKCDSVAHLCFVVYVYICWALHQFVLLRGCQCIESARQSAKVRTTDAAAWGATLWRIQQVCPKHACTDKIHIQNQTQHIPKHRQTVNWLNVHSYLV